MLHLEELVLGENNLLQSAALRECLRVWRHPLHRRPEFRLLDYPSLDELGPLGHQLCVIQPPIHLFQVGVLAHLAHPCFSGALWRLRTPLLSFAPSPVLASSPHSRWLTMENCERGQTKKQKKGFKGAPKGGASSLGTHKLPSPAKCKNNGDEEVAARGCLHGCRRVPAPRGPRLRHPPL